VRPLTILSIVFGVALGSLASYSDLSTSFVLLHADHGVAIDQGPWTDQGRGTDQGPRAKDQGLAFVWRLPLGFPTPRVPIDNPMTPEKVTLGRHLFYDKRLSGNGRQSCATCHEQARAFTDGRVGGRTIADGPHRGVGHDNPNKSPLVQGFQLTAEQKADLVAFLQTLTDMELLHDPDLADPWTR